jgi:hypothetical protein
MKLTFLGRGLFPVLLLTACSGLAPVGTLTPTQVLATDTSTPTVIWFPPTNTPTFFPTTIVQPTQDLLPGLGGLLFTDTFDQPNLWNTPPSTDASAIITRNQLVLSITGQGPVSLLSLRSQPELADFYAEVTIKVSICAGKDQFGMVFRAAGGNNYYRFSVSCDGAVRFFRTYNGTNSPMGEWETTGDAPTGAPAEVKLGVWAAGNDLRFFLNDHLQLETRDPVFHFGSLGLFVYVNGTDPITASFSNMSVYAVSYASPTPSPTPTRTPIPSRTPSP